MVRVVRSVLLVLLFAGVMTATAQDTLPPAISIDDAGGTAELTLDIPAGWWAERTEPGALFLLGPTRDGDDPVNASLTFIARSALPDFEIAPDSILMEVFAAFTGSRAQPRSIDLAGFPALYATFSESDRGRVPFIAMVDQGGYLWVLMADISARTIDADVSALLLLLDTARVRRFAVPLPGLARIAESTGTGVLRLRLPDTWALEAGDIWENIASSQAALTAFTGGEALQSGQIAGIITLYPERFLGQIGLDAQTATPSDVWLATAATLLGPDLAARVASPQAIIIGERAAASLAFQLDTQGQRTDSRVIVIDLGAAYAISVFTTPGGELSQHETTIFTIVDAMHFDLTPADSTVSAAAPTAAPALPTTDAPQTLSVFTGSGTLSLTVPAGWVAQGNNGVALFTSQGTLDALTEDLTPVEGIAGVVYALPRNTFAETFPDGTPITVVVDEFVGLLVDSSDWEATVSPAEALDFAPRAGAIVTASLDDGTDTFAALYIGIADGDALILLNIIAPPGEEISMYMETLLDIAASTVYTP